MDPCLIGWISITKADDYLRSSFRYFKGLIIRAADACLCSLYNRIEGGKVYLGVFFKLVAIFDTV